MPKNTRKPSASRQRPVSCRFCRTRKLRCSRDSPCSNCLSRNIACELEQFSNPPTVADTRERDELLDRIRKLEALVEERSAPLITKPTPTLKTPPGSVTSHTAISPSNIENQPAKDDAVSFKQSFDQDCSYLKSIYRTEEPTPDEIPSAKVAFRLCPLEHVSEIGEPSNGPCFGPSRKVFWLPEYLQALTLLEKFVAGVHHMHHIVPTQSLYCLLDRVYSALNRQEEVKSGEMILVFAIFTASMHTWSQDDCRSRGLFKTPGEAHRQSIKWAKAAEELLEIAQRITKISVEGIEGIVIMGFIASSYKGFSRRCWFLMNTAILLARETGLHCIDHPSNAEFAGTADAEIGRRAWWYLVATDWAMAAKFTGLAKGTYQCHPRQMMTNKPLNIDDEDIIDGMSRVGQHSSQPTSMTFFLLRIRLNEISRAVVDRTPYIAGTTCGPSFELIMDIDTEMQQLENEIPTFYSLSPADLSKTYNISYARALSITRQGNDFCTLLYAQCCRLHLPYAQRGYTEPYYALSRDRCIESARLIIHNETEYRRSGLSDGGTRYIPLFYSMTVFLACTVLLMDYCNSRSASHREKQRTEICQAVKLLEAARTESEMAANFMDTMVTVLHKHGIALKKDAVVPPDKSSQVDARLSDDTASAIHVAPAPIPAADFQQGPYVNAILESVALPDMALGNLTNHNDNVVSHNGDDGGFAALQAGTDLNDLVKTLDQGVDISMIDWDDIFVGLDPSFM